MDSKERWYFTKEQLENSPSRKWGCDADKELSYRQQAANFIQDMGQKLLVSQLCINTAIVYMHRFYVFHSFTLFHRNAISIAALFLAAKVEEQPRKLEHMLIVACMCLNRTQIEVGSKMYVQQVQELLVNENLILQTLGFDVAIDHPHSHIVRCCHLVKASKDLSRASYFLASNSLHLTTMCLQYKPTVVACFCIYLACKWSSWKIPPSSEGKEWYWYIDQNVTVELLEQLTTEFLIIFDKCPTKLRHKIKSMYVLEHMKTTPTDSNVLPLKRRRINSPIANSSSNSHNIQETEDTERFSHSISSKSSDMPEYTSSTTLDYVVQGLSISSQPNYYGFTNPFQMTVQQELKRTKPQVLDPFLNSQPTTHKLQLARHHAKRVKWEVSDGTLNHITKENYQTPGSNNFFYANFENNNYDERTRSQI